MKYTYHKIVLFVGTLFCSQSYATTSYFNLRSQSANLLFEMVGQERYQNHYDADGYFINFAFTPAYAQTFDGSDIARCILGPDAIQCDGKTHLVISGGDRSDRAQTDWLADYFNLPRDFKSTVQFNPRIRNILIDGNMYAGLDKWYPGLFFKLHAPLVHTRWDLGMCETINDKGVKGHQYGYFNADSGTLTSDPENTGASDRVGIPRNRLLNSFESYISDCQVLDATNESLITALKNPADQMQNTSNTIIEPLTHARMAGCNAPLTHTGLADIRFTFGYMPYIRENRSFGFGLTGAIPTGNHPEGAFLFEPIVGNGHHWELGANINAHGQLWRNQDESKFVSVDFDINITHMFNTRQKRTFDLIGRPNSRYMLAIENYGGASCDVRSMWFADTTDITNFNACQSYPEGYTVFNNKISSVANLTTLDVKVNISAQVDMVCMLSYASERWSIDFGYNLWARTCERIRVIDVPCGRLRSEKEFAFGGYTNDWYWTVKGDASVYGFDHSQISQGAFLIEIFGSQNKATINSGANAQMEMVTGADKRRNQGVDNPKAGVAASRFSSRMLLSYDPQMSTVDEQMYLAHPAIPILCESIDLESAATKGISHKLFAHFSYQWPDIEKYTPFVGGGLSAEFSDESFRSENCKDKCTRCAASQWSIWIKGGLAYN